MKEGVRERARKGEGEGGKREDEEEEEGIRKYGRREGKKERRWCMFGVLGMHNVLSYSLCSLPFSVTVW